MIVANFMEGKVDPSALTEIAHEIAEVETVLERQVDSSVALVKRVASHTLSAGGKRLRPALVSLAARATGNPFDPDRARRLGACMEMIHMATLIHDDVIDGAATRRSKPTASAAFGNTAAILSGDVLLAKAMAILAADGDLAIIRLVSEAVVELAEGEVAELESRNRLDLSEAEHFAILRMKTASFIEACCRTGARVANATPEQEDALGAYGHHIGIAFQVVDDLIDYHGHHSKTGKPRATDYREGCATLPLIFLVPSLRSEEASWIEATFGKASDADIDRVVDWMVTHGAIDRAGAVADQAVILATDALRVVPPSPQRDLLQAVAHFVRVRSA